MEHLNFNMNIIDEYCSLQRTPSHLFSVIQQQSHNSFIRIIPLHRLTTGRKFHAVYLADTTLLSHLLKAGLPGIKTRGGSVSSFSAMLTSKLGNFKNYRYSLLRALAHTIEIQTAFLTNIHFMSPST